MNLTELVSDFARYLHRINDIDVTQNCGLAEGTGSATLKTTNDIVYFLYNNQYTKVATDNIAMTACVAQAATSFCYYLVSVNASGTVRTTKGTDNTYALPATPSGNIAIGAFKIVAVATVFTSGTTDLSAAGITATFFDIDCGMAVNLINKAMRNMERGMTVIINKNPVKISNWDHMRVRATVTLSQGDSSFTMPIPNYKEFISARLTDTFGFTYPRLKKMDKQHIGLTSLQARPREIARMPNIEATFAIDVEPTFQYDIWPVCDQTYSMDVQAYQYSPTLDNVIYTSNWWTEYAPEVLLFGALAESAPYLNDDSRTAVWQAKHHEGLAALWSAQNEEKYAGAHLRIQWVDPFRRAQGNIYEFTDDTADLR